MVVKPGKSSKNVKFCQRLFAEQMQLPEVAAAEVEKRGNRQHASFTDAVFEIA
jgi:hypothetical protein